MEQADSKNSVIMPQWLITEIKSARVTATQSMCRSMALQKILQCDFSKETALGNQTIGFPLVGSLRATVSTDRIRLQ